MTGRISRVAALVATLTVTLVFALPSAHASAPPTPINGFADVHVHQFANLGFGGLVLWGQSFTPDNSIETALPWDDWTPGHYGDVVDKNGNPVGMTSCPNLLFPSKCVKHSEVLHADCPPDHGYDIFNPCDGFSVHGAGGTGDLVNAFSNGSLGHPVGGYPEFDGWPRYDNVTSQAVYYDWLQRAYKGGLRLMVMLAVNNEVLCKAGAHIAAFGCADMPAVDRQLQAAHDLEAFVDAQYGGPGQGWYRIVTTPAQARQVTAAGKLAVVLGIEVDTLFGCNKHSTCTTAYINQQLDHYKALGVTHVFPVHLTDNGFGGTALYDDMFAFNNKAVTGDWWDYADSCGPDRSFHLGTLDTLNDVAGIPIIGDWFNGLISSLLGVTGGVPPRPPAGPDCNARGLTQAGTDLVNGLIDRHMIMDVDHMDIPTFNAAMSIAEARHYPGISSGHTGIAPTANSSHAAHEGNKTLADLERIRDDGGMVSIILHQGGRNDIKTTMRGGSAPVPFDCGNSDQAWAQVYLYAADHMNGGAVGIGSDFNGLAGEPAPRFGPDACDGDKPNPYNPAAGISYPLTPFGGGAPLGQMHIGDRTFDYNNDGLANIGLYPDFIADLHQIGLSNQDLNPLFHSAEAYVRMWEAASDVAPPEVVVRHADKWLERDQHRRLVLGERLSIRPDGRGRRLVHARDQRRRRHGNELGGDLVARRLRQAEQLRDGRAVHGPQGRPQGARRFVRRAGHRMARGRRRAAVHVDRGRIRLHVCRGRVVQPDDVRPGRHGDRQRLDRLADGVRPGRELQHGRAVRRDQGRQEGAGDRDHRAGGDFIPPQLDPDPRLHGHRWWLGRRSGQPDARRFRHRRRARPRERPGDQPPDRASIRLALVCAADGRRGRKLVECVRRVPGRSSPRTRSVTRWASSAPAATS